MCGISVVVELEERNRTSRDDNTNGLELIEWRTKTSVQLHESLNLINHRGPDSRGLWISPDNRVGPLPRLCYYAYFTV